MKPARTPLELMHQLLGILLIAATFGGLGYIWYTRLLNPEMTEMRLFLTYGREYFIVFAIVIALLAGWSETGHRGR